MSDTVTLTLLAMLGTGFVTLAEVVRRLWEEQKVLVAHSVNCDVSLVKAQGDIALMEEKIKTLTGEVVDKAAEVLACKLAEAATIAAKVVTDEATVVASELKSKDGVK